MIVTKVKATLGVNPLPDKHRPLPCLVRSLGQLEGLDCVAWASPRVLRMLLTLPESRALPVLGPLLARLLLQNAQTGRQPGASSSPGDESHAGTSLGQHAKSNMGRAKSPLEASAGAGWGLVLASAKVNTGLCPCADPPAGPAGKRWQHGHWWAWAEAEQEGACKAGVASP